MAITTNKLSVGNAAAKDVMAVPFRDATNLSAVVLRIRQLRHAFLIEGVRAYCSALTAVVTGLVGTCAPGKAIQAITFVIATTTTKFKNNAAFTAVMPLRSTGTPLAGVSNLPAIVNAAVTDNIAFSSAFTINLAAAAGVFWGAVRVQMDALGVFTTKVASADQAFTTEAYAKTQCPAADPGYFDCGTITISMLTGTTFTAGTTALTGGNISAVNYNGAGAGFVNACSSDPVFVAASVVVGTMVAGITSRSVSQPGGLLVVKETTDNTGSVTDGTLEVDYRAWPLDGEVAGR